MILNWFPSQMSGRVGSCIVISQDKSENEQQYQKAIEQEYINPCMTDYKNGTVTRVQYVKKLLCSMGLHAW